MTKIIDFKLAEQLKARLPKAAPGPSKHEIAICEAAARNGVAIRRQGLAIRLIGPDVDLMAADFLCLRKSDLKSTLFEISEKYA